MTVVEAPKEHQTGYSAMNVDLAAAALGRAEIKRGDSKALEAPTDELSLPAAGMAGVLAPEGMEEAQPRAKRTGKESEVDEALRRRSVANVSRVETAVERMRLAPLVAKWAVVAAVSIAAGVVTASRLDPGEFLRGQLVVEGMNDPTVLLRETGVRELAVTVLKREAPGAPLAELESDAALREWVRRSTGDQGVLTIDVPAGAPGSDQRRLGQLRLGALLGAVAERTRPPESTVPPAQIALYADAVRAAEANLQLAKEALEGMEKKAKESPKLTALLEDAARLQSTRDQLAARFAAMRESPPPVVDPDARAQLDRALQDFARNLDRIRNTPNVDERLAPFVAAALSVQESGARLTAQILQRRDEEAQALLALKKRLDERMQLRRQQAWDADDELKRLATQLDDARRRFEASDPGNAIRRQDLRGEMDYIEQLIKARKQQLGGDKADASAVAEVQRIIDAQAEATKQDRQRLTESFAQMREALTSRLPQTGSVAADQRKLATDLQESLNQLQQSRATLTEASATALAKHEQQLSELQTQLEKMDKSLAEVRGEAEAVRAALPRTSQLDEARSKVTRIQAERAAAVKTLEEAQKPPPPREVIKPTYEVVRPDIVQSRAIGVGVALVVLVAVGLYVKDRF